MDATGPAEDVPTGFSSPKKAVIALRKRKPRSTLRTVARSLGVSRAAAWKHLARLEGAGLVERECRAGRPGRPAAMFRLSAPSQRLFPGAYTQLTLGALAFLERRLGRAAVVGRLEERAAGLAERHRPRLAGRDLEGRVCELARIRDEEGYVAEVDRGGPRRFGLVEHHCPILAIAGRYGEACDVERRLFRDLLAAPVDVRHRVVAGDPVCRFLIRADARSESA